MLYLDYAASSPLLPQVLDSLQQSMARDFANPASSHSLGKSLNEKLESYRFDFLKWLGDDRGKLIFTASATEANNILIKGLSLKEGSKILYSKACHPSLTGPVQCFESSPYNLKSDGKIDVENLLESIDNSVGLVLLTLVNSQSGIFQEIVEISKEIKRKKPNTHIHVDAVQGFTKLPCLVSENIDSMSISSHKVRGPKGVGALYFKSHVKLKPLFYGGGQEGGLRSSTQALPLIEAFWHAAGLGLEMRENSYERAMKLNGELRSALAKIPEIEFPFAFSDASPYILTFIFNGLSSDIILRHLEMRKVYISSTSACSSKMKGENPVFSALGIPSSKHKFVLRVSFGQDFTSEMKDKFVGEINDLYEEINFLIKR